MKRIAYITNASPLSGVGNRASHIAHTIRGMASDISLADFRIDGAKGQLSQGNTVIRSVKKWPAVLGSKSINWWRLGRQLTKHLRHLDTPSFDMYHATNQSLSWLAHSLSPAIVTVHDLIEILEPQDTMAALVNQFLYSGITKASHIIAVSEYTKQTLLAAYDISSEHITVIPNGVDATFHPIPDFRASIGYRELLRALRLPAKAGPIVLYVGSDHPRKNLTTLITAFAKLLQAEPSAVLIKVGAPGRPQGRKQFLENIDAAGIRHCVTFVNKVGSEAGLNEFYNLADIVVFPSRFEGFGLPPLQAMAAGTPVVCSNATSLPEVVGDNGKYGEQAALVCDPDDIDCFAKSIKKAVSDASTAANLRRQGIERAKQFSWKKAANAELAVYRQLL